MYKYNLLALLFLSIQTFAGEEIIKHDCVGQAILAKATIEAKQRGTNKDEFKDYLLKLLLDTPPTELLHTALPSTVHRVDRLYRNYTRPTDAYVNVFNQCMQDMHTN